MAEQQRQLTALELEDVAEYERVVRFSEEFLAGKHPRMRKEALALKVKRMKERHPPSTRVSFEAKKQQKLTHKCSHSPTGQQSDLEIDFNQNYYSILGVESHLSSKAKYLSANIGTIGKAYSPLSDLGQSKHNSSDLEVQSAVQQHWERVKKSYIILTDEDLRRQYDEGREEKLCPHIENEKGALFKVGSPHINSIAEYPTSPSITQTPKIVIEFNHNYYNDLGVQSHVTVHAIRRGFKDRERLYSPLSPIAYSKYNSDNPKVRRDVRKGWEKIQKACEILTTPDLRREYDKGREAKLDSGFQMKNLNCSTNANSSTEPKPTIVIDFNHNYYSDLGVQSHVSAGSIDRAFKARSGMLYPFSNLERPKHMPPSMQVRKKLQERWQTIRNAHAILSDDKSRRVYDDGRGDRFSSKTEKQWKWGGLEKREKSVREITNKKWMEVGGKTKRVLEEQDEVDEKFARATKRTKIADKVNMKQEEMDNIPTLLRETTATRMRFASTS